MSTSAVPSSVALESVGAVMSAVLFVTVWSVSASASLSDTPRIRLVAAHGQRESATAAGVHAKYAGAAESDHGVGDADLPRRLRTQSLRNPARGLHEDRPGCRDARDESLPAPFTSRPAIVSGHKTPSLRAPTASIPPLAKPAGRTPGYRSRWA